MYFQDIKIISIKKPYNPYGERVSKPLKPASDLFAHVPRLTPKSGLKRRCVITSIPLVICDK